MREEEKAVPTHGQAKLLPAAETPIGMTPLPDVKWREATPDEIAGAPTGDLEGLIDRFDDLVSKLPTQDIRTTLPRYRSHEIVRAGVITKVENVEDSCDRILSVEIANAKNPTTIRFTVGEVWANDHEPVVGTVLVIRADGRMELESTQDFEDHYTEVTASMPAVEGDLSAYDHLSLAIECLESSGNASLTSMMRTLAAAMLTE
jgi:hypothetical protein